MLCCLLGSKVYSQPTTFAQYYFAPQKLNPASFEPNHDQVVWKSIYRQQNTSVGVNLNTTALSVAYPVSYSNDNTFAQVNMLALKDRTGQGGAFHTNEVGLGYNQTLKVQRAQYLSLGMQMKYVNKRFSLADYSTGTQYIPGQGHDPVISNGEESGLKNSFMSWSLGGYWYALSDLGGQRFYTGIALFNVNKPNESLVGIESQLPIQYQLHAGYSVFEQQNVQVMANVLYTHYGGINEVNVGGTVSYSLEEEKKVVLQTNYSTGQGASVGVRFHMPKYAAGFSYAVPLGERSQLFSSIMEFGLEVKHPTLTIRFNKRKRRRRKRRNRKPYKKQVGVQPKKEAVIKEPVPKNEDKEINEDLDLKEAIETEVIIGKVEEDPIPKEVFGSKTFHFSFGSNALPLDEKQELLSLISSLKKYPQLHIKVIGHTDNVGSTVVNYKLSVERATHVAQLLLAEGVSPEQIEVLGKGETLPLVDNSTSSNRAKNRRVEIKVTVQK